MESAKGKMEVCKNYDEVNAEDGSILSPMKEETLKFGCQLREDSKCNQNGVIWQAEENANRKPTGPLNSRNSDKGQIATMEIKEVR